METISLNDYWGILSDKEAQGLLDALLKQYYLDIVEVMRDGEKVDYMSTEGEHLEITVRAKEKPNA